MSSHYRNRKDYDGKAGCGCAVLTAAALVAGTVVLWEIGRRLGAFLAALIVAGA